MKRFALTVTILLALCGVALAQEYSSPMFDGGNAMHFGIGFHPEWKLLKFFSVRTGVDFGVFDQFGTNTVYGASYCLGLSVEPRWYFTPGALNKGYLGISLQYGLINVPYGQPAVQMSLMHYYGYAVKIGYKWVTIFFAMFENPAWIVLEPSVSYGVTYYSDMNFSAGANSAGWLTFDLTMSFDLPVFPERRSRENVSRESRDVPPAREPALTNAAATNANPDVAGATNAAAAGSSLSSDRISPH